MVFACATASRAGSAAAWGWFRDVRSFALPVDQPAIDCTALRKLDSSFRYSNVRGWVVLCGKGLPRKPSRKYFARKRSRSKFASSVGDFSSAAIGGAGFLHLGELEL